MSLLNWSACRRFLLREMQNRRQVTMDKVSEDWKPILEQSLRETMRAGIINASALGPVLRPPHSTKR